MQVTQPLPVLREIVDLWLGEKDGNTKRLLSIKTGIPYSSLLRYLQGESDLNFSICLKILETTAPLQKMVNFLQSYFSKEFKSISYLLENLVKNSKNSPGSVADFRDSLQKISYFHIIALASSSYGTTRSEIIHQLGDYGIKIVDELVNKELVIEEDKILKTGKDLYNTDSDTAMAIVRNSIDIFTRSSNPSYLASRIERINYSALKKIQDILVEAVQKINEVIDNPESIGSIPISVNLLLGVLLTNKIDLKTYQNFGEDA